MTEPLPVIPAASPDGESGFTLIEVLVALGVMTFGLTVLLGAMSFAVGTRRGAEMRARAASLAESVMHDVEQRLLPEHPVPPDWEDPKELAIAPAAAVGVPDQAGMTYSIQYSTAGEQPDLVLVTVRVQWRDDGEEDGEVFTRVLPRGAPLALRVAQRRNP